MPSTSSLINDIRSKFDSFSFAESDTCRWSPSEQTVYYNLSGEPEDAYILLHEVAHGVLEHQSYDSDIELLQKEVMAWEHAAKVLAPDFNIIIPDDFISGSLDTYRNWLHSRSLCPNCHQNGIQTKNDTYECINCRCRWRVNDARQCQLKRYKITQQK